MITRKSLLGIAAAAMLVTVLPGATFAQDELEVTPEGAVWSLISVGDLEVPAEVGANLYMEAGEANGNAGCNSFSGTYELDGASLSFAPEMAVTLAICGGPSQDVEDAHLPALGAVASWSIEGNILSLADESGTVVLTYEEPTVDLTVTDIEALIGELTRLDDRITKTRQDVRSLNIPKTQIAVEENTAAIDALAKTVKNQNVPGLRDRVIANEAVLTDLTDRFTNLRARVRDLEGRVKALEDAQ
jgi:heat shock protein HslJ